jgi:hypothetical protein
MEWFKHTEKKSRLGQILVDQKLISPFQLEEAILEQERTGQRLGDILAQWKLASRRQISSAMRVQRTIRVAAAIAAAVLDPIDARAADMVQPAVAMSAFAEHHAMQALDDAALGEVSAQGFDQPEPAQAQPQAQPLPFNQLFDHLLAPDLHSAGAHLHDKDGLRVLAELAKLFNPLAGLLSADVTVSDVSYDPANSGSVLNADGSITLHLPSSIGHISIKNLRVGHSGTGPSFGSIDISHIDLRGTTITITGH